MTVCVVKYCHNSDDKHKKSDSITFHSFPADPVIANRWIEIIRRNRRQDWWKPSNYTKICSVHFCINDKYETKKGLRRIRRGAVPTKRLFLSISDSDSEEENAETHEDSSKIICDERINTDLSSYSRPGTSTGLAMIASANIADENAKVNEKTLNIGSEPKIDSSDLDSVLNTPRKAKLRRELRRKSTLLVKYVKMIKTLKQKNRRLIKINSSLKEILINLKKQRYIDNYIVNILSRNVFAAELYNNLCKKIGKNKKTHA